MVEPAPVTAFKVPQPQLLFQFLIVPFNDPALFGHFDQSFELGVSRQRRYPVFGGFFLSLAAIRSATIPPREVPLFHSPDEQHVRELRQKRDCNLWSVPSRQVISLKAREDRSIANCATETG